MFENLKNVFDLIKKKFNHYFSDLIDKEEKSNRIKERKLAITDNIYWLDICQKSKLNNIHIAAKQKNNIAF